MNQLQKWVGLVGVGLFIAGSVLAAENAPFSSQPAPTQSYHTMTSQDTSATQSVTSASDASNTSTVSSAQAPSSSSVTAASSAQPASQDYLPQTAANNTAQSDDSNFDQTTTQHIAELDTSTQAIASAVQTLNQNVSQLQQEVNILQTTQMKSAPTQTVSASKINRQTLDDFIAMAGIAVFLLLLGMLFGRMMRRQPKLVTPGISARRVSDILVDENRNEYDFMNSHAAIPAQLDLARSYIAMRDYDQARAVLKTVLEKGNDEQRKAAEELLKKSSEA